MKTVPLIFALCFALTSGLIIATRAEAGRGGGGGGRDGGARGGGPAVKGEISIQLPPGWALNDDASFVAVAAQADKDDTGQYIANLSINGGRGVNEINAAAQQEMMKKQLPNYSPVEQPAQVMVGNIQAWRFGGTFTRNNLQLRARQYLVPIDNRVYVITFITLASKWGEYDPAIGGSVASFRVRREPATRAGGAGAGGGGTTRPSGPGTGTAPARRGTGRGPAATAPSGGR